VAPKPARVVLGLAALLGAAVTLFIGRDLLRDGARRPTTDADAARAIRESASGEGPGPSAPFAVAAPGGASEASGAPPETEPATPAAVTAGGTLRVRVLDAESGEAIAGATVVSIRDSEAAVEAGTPLAADVVATATTDETGACVVEVAGASSGRVVARAAGRTSAERAFTAQTTEEVVLRLAAGLAIAGRVVDVAGTPLPGVDLSCAHEALPRATDGPPLPPRPGRETASARSDEEGAFRLAGLSPGRYRVVVESGGWTLDQAVRKKTVRSPSGVDALHVDAGTDALEVTLVRVRAVAVRLVDAASRLPVASSVASVAVFADGAKFGTSVASYATAARPATARWGADEDVVRAEVLLGPGEPPARATADVRAEGYAPASAEVALRAPGEAAGAAPDVVALTRLDADATASIVVDCGRDLGRVLRPRTRILTACRLADGRMTYLRGRPVEGRGDRVRFDGLPPGESSVTVFDGVSHSRPARATIAPGDPAAVAVTFPPPTGIVFALKDAAGGRAYDADVLLVAPADRREGAPNRSEATRLVVDAAGPLSVLVPLPPGEYRWAAFKHGTGYAGGEIRIVDGGVARAAGTLRPRVKDSSGTARSSEEKSGE
jgi:hypothetical protein